MLLYLYENTLQKSSKQMHNAQWLRNVESMITVDHGNPKRPINMSLTSYFDVTSMLVGHGHCT